MGKVSMARAGNTEAAGFKAIDAEDDREKRISAFRFHFRSFFTRDEVEEMAEALDAMGYFDAPASTRFHGSYDGGLYDHSRAVAKNLVELTEKLGLVWEKERSPFVIGFLHDLCKCDLYLKRPDGSYAFNKAADTRHGEKSVEMARALVPDLTEEEAVCIRWHMGAYDDKEKWNDLGRGIEQYHNVLWAHTADMMAAKFDLI